MPKEIQKISEQFTFDVFLSHSSKDKTVVREVAEQLRADGLRVWLDEWVLKPGDSIPVKIEEGLENSRVLVLCMSANAFGSDWAQLESNTFRFRDPLNKERHFIPLRLDDAHIKGSLAQFLYINWLPEKRDQEYAKLLLACSPASKPKLTEAQQRFQAEIFSLGHTDLIRSVAWSPDGTCALSGADDNTVRLWEVETGHCIRVLEGHNKCVLSVAWSPDGTRVLSGASDNTMRLWEIETGRCTRVLEGHNKGVLSVAWSPNGIHALSGAGDSMLRLWEVETGHCIRGFSGHTDSVRSVAWSPDGTRALSGAGDSTLRMWDVKTGHCIRVFEGHTKGVLNVMWNPDSTRALSGAGDSTLRMWDVKTGHCIRIFEGHTNSVRSVVWSPDGTRALSGSSDKTLRLWEVKTGCCLRVLESHIGWIRSVAWSLDGTRALSGADDSAVRLWDVETGFCLKVLEGHTDSVWSLAWSPDGTRALSGAVDKTVRLWDVETGFCLKVLEGHTDSVWSLAWSPDGTRALSGADDSTIRLWKLETGRCLRVFKGHIGSIRSVVWSPDGTCALSGASDNTLRLWEVKTGRCLRVLEGHTGWIRSVTWSLDGTRALSGADDNTVRLWEVETGCCLRVLEGHTDSVWSVEWSPDSTRALSGASDKTVRLWEVKTGRCLRVLEGHTDSIRSVAWSSDGTRAFSSAWNGVWRVWALALGSSPSPNPAVPDLEQIQYSNAKVLLVGDTNAGKTGLTHRLATGQWKPSEDSTVGAWSTQWQLQDSTAELGVSREIWLWDFGGQADQRLIHQLYMDRTALILLLFNADQEDVLPGLRDWQAALRRCVRETIPHFIVAGRIDTGFRASREKLQAFANEQCLVYHETSAKSGEGCDELRTALLASLPWDRMEKRTSPRIFKLIKDEILKLRDEGQVLHTFKELRELLLQRLPNEPRFTDDVLQTVISLLDGPGVVKELDYGTYILLAPEWINAYAQAVIRTLRSAENDLGVLPLRSIAEGQLIYQSIGRDGAAVEMKRLPSNEERVVLGEMELQLEQRGLCLRQGDKLVFPSHCGRDRPAVQEHPSIFVSYAVKGFLDDIYATLVVKLADSESFHLKELWRDAADFETLADKHHMGLKLARESGSDGEISVYFGQGVTQQEQVIFANYIHSHLENTCEKATRLRHYVCSHCHTPKGNPEVLMKKLLAKKQDADTECDGCGKRFPLWDALEQKFASEEVRKMVEAIQTDDLAKLDSRRKGKLLVLDVGARIISANQKWWEIPQEEDDGIDIMVEFTDEDGNGIGKGLCLQLKAGNSHLTKRKKDGVEIFAIKKQRWVQTWMNQPYPVMLVIGTFSDADERASGKHKVEFSDVRWMEISSVLKQKSQNGTKQVRQIEFKGERLDLSSIRRWREKIIQEG